jgi:HEAT repeat protein
VHDALNAREPDLRASACRCARFWPAAIPRLIELLDDLNHDVARDAAIALGVAGQCEAMPFLVGLVMQEPTNEVIEALVTVGSDECFVALGRVADVWPDLRHLVIRALAASDHRLATTLLRRIDPDHPMIVTDER